MLGIPTCYFEFHQTDEARLYDRLEDALGTVSAAAVFAGEGREAAASIAGLSGANDGGAGGPMLGVEARAAAARYRAVTRRLDRVEQAAQERLKHMMTLITERDETIANLEEELRTRPSRAEYNAARRREDALYATLQRMALESGRPSRPANPGDGRRGEVWVESADYDEAADAANDADAAAADGYGPGALDRRRMRRDRALHTMDRASMQSSISMLQNGWLRRGRHVDGGGVNGGGRDDGARAGASYIDVQQRRRLMELAQTCSATLELSVDLLDVLRCRSAADILPAARRAQHAALINPELARHAAAVAMLVQDGRDGGRAALGGDVNTQIEDELRLLMHEYRVFKSMESRPTSAAHTIISRLQQLLGVRTVGEVTPKLEDVIARAQDTASWLRQLRALLDVPAHTDLTELMGIMKMHLRTLGLA
eukprot:g3186.t1